MTSWLEFVPALLVAIAIATLPGLPIAWALRLRGLAMLAAAVAASFAVVAVAGTAAPIAGLGWGILPVAIVTALATAILLPVRLRSRRAEAAAGSRPNAPRAASITAASLLLAFLVVTWVLATGIGGPQHFSQSYDNVFHLNATAFILDTGNASPLAMTMNTLGEPGYYPTLWHATAALVAQLSGVGVAAATNAVSFAVAAWVWPVGMLLFGRLVAGGGWIRSLAIAGLSAGAATFPYHALAWGVLYPNMLSTALLPIALGFLLLGLRSGGPANWVAFAGATGAASLAHPNALLGLGVFAIPMLIARGVRLLRAAPPGRTWRLLGIALGLITIAVLWAAIDTSDKGRTYDYSLVSALGSALSGAPMVAERAWGFALLTATGIVLLVLRRRELWLVAAYGLGVVLYVVAAATTGSLRDALTGGWYNDPHRIAYLLPIAAIPLAAVALGALLQLLSVAVVRARRRLPGSWRWLVRPLVIVPALIAVLFAAQGPSVAAARAEINMLFSFDEPQGLVSEHELALLERLPKTTPQTALIAGNPWNGSAFAYALGQRHVLFPHLQSEKSAEMEYLAEEFSQLPPGEACELVDGLGVTHVLESTEPTYQDRSGPFDGLDEVGGSSLLTQIDAEGGAVLYEVTGC